MDIIVFKKFKMIWIFRFILSWNLPCYQTPSSRCKFHCFSFRVQSRKLFFLFLNRTMKKMTKITKGIVKNKSFFFFLSSNGSNEEFQWGIKRGFHFPLSLGIAKRTLGQNLMGSKFKDPSVENWCRAGHMSFPLTAPQSRISFPYRPLLPTAQVENPELYKYIYS